MSDRRFDETAPARIMKFWPFLVCIALGLIAYGSMQAQLGRAQEDIKEIRQDIKTILGMLH